MKRNAAKEKLPRTQKAAHGVGHVLNDLIANVWFSYLLIYLTKVAGLSNSGAGYVAMLGQVVDGICTPIIAILNDRTVCRYGRRKIWHLGTWVLVAITFPLMFTRVLPIDTSYALKLVYHLSIAGLIQFGWGCMQISHLSLIPEIARSESERVELNAIRSALRFVCGIFVFGVTWILLGRSSEATISHNTWKQFMYLSIIVTGTGSVFNLIFHIWTKEPPTEALLRWKEKKRAQKQSKSKGTVDELELNGASACSNDFVATVGEKRPCAEQDYTEEEKPCNMTINEDDLDQKTTRIQWLKKPELYKVGFIYIATRLYVNVSQAYFPLYLLETMRFEKESVAYFPLVVLVAGVLASVGMKPLTKRIGSKATFCIGAILGISASCWFKLQPISSRNAAYAPAVLMGIAGSVMLVTSLSLIAHLIGHDKKSGAFVYGAIGFMDKIISGAVFVVIQEINPSTDENIECLPCAEFLRNVQSIVTAAPVALMMLFVIFDSAFLCRRRVQVNHIATQTSLDEQDAEDVKCHTVRAETSRSHFCVYENEGLSLSEENLLASSTENPDLNETVVGNTAASKLPTNLDKGNVKISKKRNDNVEKPSEDENRSGEVVSNEAVSGSLTKLDEVDVKIPNTPNEHVEMPTEDESKGENIHDADTGKTSSRHHEINEGEGKDTSGWVNSAPTDFEDEESKDTSIGEDADSGFEVKL